MNPYDTFVHFIRLFVFLTVGGCCFLPTQTSKFPPKKKKLEVNYGMTLTPPMWDAMLLQNLRSLYLESVVLFNGGIRRYMQEKKHMEECELLFF